MSFTVIHEKCGYNAILKDRLERLERCEDFTLRVLEYFISEMEDGKELPDFYKEAKEAYYGIEKGCGLNGDSD